MNSTPLYFDHNATTPMAPEAIDAMLPFLRERFANPSGPYQPARAAFLAIHDAREAVAAMWGADPEGVIFTSGGTESNNLAVLGAASARPGRDVLVVSAVEHASVLEAAARAEERGARVRRVGVDRAGRIDMPGLRASIDERTALVSVMAANNETGVRFPIAEIAAVAHAAGAWFHTDAAQCPGRVPLDVDGADVVTLCAHKMRGPKGVGALWVRPGIALAPQVVGGGQERGRRGGTENVAAIVGFGAAARYAAAAEREMGERILGMRNRIESAIADRATGVTRIGAGELRLPNTAMLLVDRVDPEALLAALDLRNVCCSSGSACASGGHEPSHVLRAMGWTVGARTDPAPLRISLGIENLESDAEILVDAVIDSVGTLRNV